MHHTLIGDLVLRGRKMLLRIMQIDVYSLNGITLRLLMEFEIKLVHATL